MVKVDGSKWPEMKKELTENGTLAFGALPLLEHKDKKIVQTLAIARYLGRLYNLY